MTELSLVLGWSLDEVKALDDRELSTLLDVLDERQRAR